MLISIISFPNTFASFTKDCRYLMGPCKEKQNTQIKTRVRKSGIEGQDKVLSRNANVQILGVPWGYEN